MSEMLPSTGMPTESGSTELKPKRSRLPFYVTLGGFFLFLVILIVPAVLPCGGAAKPRRNICLMNLHQIDAAKQLWALENHKLPTDTPTVFEVTEHFKDSKMLKCPQGGSYTLHTVSENPTCSFPGHTL